MNAAAPRTVPVPANQDRRAYLREVCDLLWPPPAVVTVGGGGRAGRQAAAGPPHTGPPRAGPPHAGPPHAGPPHAGPPRAGPLHSEFIVLPGLSRPRLLVPPASRPAAAAVRRYGEPGSRNARLATRALSIALASGLGGKLLRGRVRVHAAADADTIETYLRAELARDVRLSMHLGEPRANRKPVLQLLSTRGEPAGFAKIGVNPLTSGLVRAERDALGRLHRAGLRDVTVPRVLHHGEWHGLDVLVLSALPVWLRRRPLPWTRLAAAMAEIAAVDGLHEAPLADGAYWQRLASRLAAADQDADRAALTGALGVLATRAGGTLLTFGAWHGDWTPWNMASTDQGLLVWDWERFTGDVPLGFDALHYWLQTAVVPARGEPRAAAAECVDRAPQLLAPFGAGGPEARLTAIVYLADLATRYLADRQARAGARLGIAGDWLIPAITDAVAQL